jgi:hypothetical protein
MNASARTTSTAMGAFAERAPIRSRATVSPFPAAPDAIGRNAPCPCASGRRYKHCHGTDGPAPLPVIPEAVAGIMRRALACQRAEHLQEAAALYREVLAQVPDLPDAVHMLGVTHLQAGDYDEALAVLRRAAELFGWRLASVRHNLGLALAAIVARHDRPDAARLWEEYDRWRDRVRGERRAASPLVSVVVPSFNHARYVTEALESVFRQSYANIEIVVVDDGSTDDSPARIRAALARSPFPAHFVERGNRGAAPTINEGIALARGEFVNVLNSDDRFAPTRIATMVDAVARAGFQWGFSRAVSIGAAGEALAASASQRAGDLAYMIDGVAACDTVGMAFLSSNRALSSGTLFCARSLLDRLGGFADLRYNNDWDFCLRACCIAEPVFVSSPEYDYRLHGANTILESAAAAKREADAMFERFHREAAALTAPENPFAPVPSVWGARFYEQMLASGRAALLPPDVLRELTDRVAATYGFAP